jgi:4-diphosphocytidyl-2-C-methyl-D-erythritol kinase
VIFWKLFLQKLPQIRKNQIFQTGITYPGAPEDNLCIKAYNLMAQEFKLPAVNIHLRKQIPVGAGLGGGSADAACTAFRVK